MRTRPFSKSGVSCGSRLSDGLSVAHHARFRVLIRRSSVPLRPARERMPIEYSKNKELDIIQRSTSVGAYGPAIPHLHLILTDFAHILVSWSLSVSDKHRVTLESACGHCKATATC